jgi:PKD repeat protein
MSSQFQLKEAGDAWSQLIIDSKRDWENVYYDTGPPNYVPIDLNAGIDLQRYQITEGALQSSQLYEWRIRYRDQNLLWSDWSTPVTFTAMETGNTVDFSADITEGDVPLLVRFTDFSTGDPVLWSWDLDGDQITDSEEQDPEWLYELSGTYNVSLTVNYQNEELTITKEAYITAGQFSQVDISFNEGWDMIGLPLEVENPNYQILFPEAVENTLYNFNMGYNLAEDLEAGIGYWMRLYNSGVTQLEGYVISEIEIELNEGWNLISGISEVTSIANFIDPEEIIIPNTAYTFENGYINTDVFNPGNGYWIRAYQDGTIIIDNSGLAYRESNFEHDISGTCNSLTFNGISLFFGVDIPENMKLSYSLPPKPPSGAFDVRFSGDTRIMMDKAEIEVMSPYETITISYDVVLDAGEYMHWVLSIGSGEEYILEQDGEITVPTEDTFTLERKAIIPISYALHQNYPNPFNPITTLRYGLPVQAQVTITIYDLMGKEVTQLVNTTQDAGFSSVQWNATDMYGKPVSAGVYLYQIRAGEFVQTRKMVLLK